ncbi:MAG: hypothetical protein LBQ44_10515, partial [Treponema sp.]|nr:hypothetical protein [Treponema sp.]
AFILDGKGIVIAHPESRYLEELYNYKTMTRTVSVKDGAGNIRWNGEGNILTTEEAFPISAEYREAVSDMMTGGGGRSTGSSPGSTR